jgi:hypothetical protein
MFSEQLLQRSEGRIRASSVDPGAVDTGIFRRHSIFAPAAKWLGSLGMFSSPEEGCRAVLHACTAPWPYKDCDNEQKQAQTAPFYARGLFAQTPLVMGGRNGMFDCAVRGLFIGVCGLLDQPLRTVLGGRLGTGETYLVAANQRALDSKLGGSLWCASSRLCGLGDEIAST